MATRTRRSWKPDPRGYYSRQIGWVTSKSGKLQQQKFILGTDKKVAETRERKLRELWEQFENTSSEARPLWPDDLLQIGKQIAKGNTAVVVQRAPREMQMTYANRVQRMQAEYPVILFVPEDQRAYDVGLAALEEFDSIPTSDELKTFSASLETIDVSKVQAQLLAESIQSTAGIKTLCTPDAIQIANKRYAEKASNPPSPLSNVAYGSAITQGNGRKSRTPSATLHKAIKEYQKYVKREFHRPEVNQISAWGRTQVRQLNTLMKHHSDMLLMQIDATAVNELIGYWRRRPCKTGTNLPMASKSCGNYLSALTRFLKWLDTSSEFDWSKPMALSDVDTRVRRLAIDHANRGPEQVKTFTRDELRLLIRYAQPLDRLIVLLALNCGFGNAEIASILVGEVHLLKAHSEWEQELIGIKTTEEDSFIKRVRRKSGVYGEHILYPITVQGIQWALEQRKEHPEFGPSARLLLNTKGKPLDTPTKTGNANQTISNRFDRLIERIQNDGNEIRKLSFGKLRKTASQLIKMHSDGETMGVFDCHGSPVKSDSLNDAYSNRLFGRVFQAIQDVEAYLAPVFKEAGRNPFAPQAQAYTKRSTIDRIIELHEAGEFTGQIAAAVGLSGEAVSRHIQRHRQVLANLE